MDGSSDNIKTQDPAKPEGKDEMAVITDRLQYIFVKVVIAGFRAKSLPVADAKKWAKELLGMKPLTSLAEAEEKIGKFVEGKKDLKQMKNYLDAYDEEKRLEAVIERMRTHLKKNEIDKALEVAKQH